MLITFLRKFMATEASGGLLLMIAAILAVAMANSPLQGWYHYFFSETVLFWINDGLMVIFFFVIGMEIKRECVEGELSSPSQITLPIAAALGGMLCPALLYSIFNLHNGEALHGWAVSSATDIAFSLCILSLCGKRIPLSLKIFLTAIAVIDDLGAIIIIALFYIKDFSLLWLWGAFLVINGLILLNIKRVSSFLWYALFGLILWFAIFKSGIHPTIAGVTLGLFIPLKPSHHGHSMLLRLEHKLHPYVSYGIMPLFAFANAGINLTGFSLGQLNHPVTLGIIVGLFAGKQLGIFLCTASCIALGLATRPKDATWLQLYGISLIAGIGFTMSLFIGGLAFGEGSYFTDAKFGIIIGSLLSAICGYGVLRMKK
jgi:NhaA family Na+:H+ antiporter